MRISYGIKFELITKVALADIRKDKYFHQLSHYFFNNYFLIIKKTIPTVYTSLLFATSNPTEPRTTHTHTNKLVFCKNILVIIVIFCSKNLLLFF